MVDKEDFGTRTFRATLLFADMPQTDATTPQAQGRALAKARARLVEARPCASVRGGFAHEDDTVIQCACRQKLSLDPEEEQPSPVSPDPSKQAPNPSRESCNSSGHLFLRATTVEQSTPQPHVRRHRTEPAPGHRVRHLSRRHQKTAAAGARNRKDTPYLLVRYPCRRRRGRGRCHIGGRVCFWRRRRRRRSPVRSTTACIGDAAPIPPTLLVASSTRAKNEASAQNRPTDHVEAKWGVGGEGHQAREGSRGEQEQA